MPLVQFGRRKLFFKGRRRPGARGVQGDQRHPRPQHRRGHGHGQGRIQVRGGQDLHEPDLHRAGPVPGLHSVSQEHPHDWKDPQGVQWPRGKRSHDSENLS